MEHQLGVKVSCDPYDLVKNESLGAGRNTTTKQGDSKRTRVLNKKKFPWVVRGEDGNQVGGTSFVEE